MSVTPETFQSLRDWLKEMASWNIRDMVVTDETFQSLRDWLKATAA